jgi:hypothetical protein
VRNISGLDEDDTRAEGGKRWLRGGGEAFLLWRESLVEIKPPEKNVFDLLHCIV